MSNTKELAHKLIEMEFWKSPTYNLQTLFRIRDCLLILKSINPLFCDETLLEEVNKYIDQKQEKSYVA